MRTPVIVLIAALLTSACGPFGGRDDPVAILKAARAETMADLVRHEAECRAMAIEFHGDPLRDQVVSSCLDTHRVMLDMARHTLSDIDRRLSELGAPQQTISAGVFEDLIPKQASK